MDQLEKLKRNLRSYIDSGKAEFLPRFFKTAAGEYGAGDKFLGVTVPNQRKVAKRYSDLELESVKRLLQSEFHEERLTALFILVLQFQSAIKNEQLDRCQALLNLYLSSAGPVGFEYVNRNSSQLIQGPQKNPHRFFGGVNNWDLVDSSAPYILGAYLVNKDRALLYKLAQSDSVWERRMAIVATYHFIKKGEFNDTLKISRMLLKDPHDLIHKAVGWMLREVGNRSAPTLRQFLDQHARAMPRTMLRYAIEKLSPSERQRYMSWR